MASNQRMAGDIWKTYDANSQGGNGFDDNDLKYLQGQKWSNNDILKAAARSGSVNSNTSSALSKLNSSTAFKDLPKSVQKGFGRGSSANYVRSGGSYTFMGGDANDSSNYRVSNDDTGNSKQSIESFVMGLNADGAKIDWNKKVESKYGSEIYQWGGINADGSANGLSGYKESYDDKDKKTPFKRQNVSWALPSDMVENSRQADFDKRYSAKQPAQNSSPTNSATAKPKFDIRNFSTPATASSTGNLPSGFVADTKATAYEGYKSRQAAAATTPASRPTYTPKTVDHSATSNSSSASGGLGSDPNRRWRQFWDPSDSRNSGAQPILSR